MSRKQWIGLVIVVIMVSAVELCVFFTKRWAGHQPHPEFLAFQPEREEAFLAYLDSLNKADYAARKAQYTSRYTKPEIHLQPFDPNTADSTLLVSVGLKPFMAKNLIRYRQAGKVFRHKDELRTLYGMTDSLYATLEPFIRVDTIIADSLSRHSRDIVETLSREKRDTILELNTADTAELCLLRGIGTFSAVRIIRYRQALGGYYSVQQLYEIKDISQEHIDHLLPLLYADTTLITPIDVNRATVKQLYRHPYISYPQAEQLYNLRRSRGHLRSMDELTSVFTPDERLRLAPYLLFDAH